MSLPGVCVPYRSEGDTPLMGAPHRRSMGPGSQQESDIVHHPTVHRMTIRCKNITFPQLLRWAVINCILSMLNGLYMNSVVGTHLLFTTIRGFPKIDHSDIDARIVLEQNRFSKKATPNRTRNLNPRTVVLTACVQSHALTTVLIPIT